jgi:hypothetical protein
MNMISRLSGPAFRPRCIELDGGVRKHSTTITATGRHDLVVAGGVMHFFVELVEEDGGRVGLWDGSDLGEGIRHAERAQIEFGIVAPVHDLFGGAR